MWSINSTATTQNVMIACKPISGAVVGVMGGPDAGTETRSDVACLVYDMCSHGSGTGAHGSSDLELRFGERASRASLSSRCC